MDNQGVKEIAELAKASVTTQVEILKRGARGGVEAPVLIVPAGHRAESIKAHLDEYLEAPERRKGTATLLDLDSFIGHVKRFADEDSALFATQKPPTLVGVIDYHRKTAGGAPRFGQHRASYDFPVSDEWKLWTSRNAQPFQQVEFAAWIEDRLLDVLDPAGAGEVAKKMVASLGAEFASPTKLVELSKGLTVHVNSRVRNSTSLSTGEVQFNFATEHADAQGQPLKVPAAFLIGIPVFRNGAVYQLAVRLRYAVRDGVVTWRYEMYRHERAFDDAISLACQHAAKETGLPLFMGTPETATEDEEG